jgi:hypothetical protein
MRTGAGDRIDHNSDFCIRGHLPYRFRGEMIEFICVIVTALQFAEG